MQEYELDGLSKEEYLNKKIGSYFKKFQHTFHVRDACWQYSVYAELKSEPTPGFDFKFNNSRAYAMQTGTAAAWRRGDVLDDGMWMMA